MAAETKTAETPDLLAVSLPYIQEVAHYYITAPSIPLPGMHSLGGPSHLDSGLGCVTCLVMRHRPHEAAEPC